MALCKQSSLFGCLLLFFCLAAPWPVLALTPNDPMLDEQWYLPQIRAEQAWDATTGSRDVIVAVLDSGIDLDHPDLEGNIWTNEDEIAGDGLDNDDNGYIDDVHGWDFVDDDANVDAYEDPPYDATAVSHGTMIAGLIGAVGNNAEGMAGLNWNVKIMPLRILDTLGSGTSTRATEALEYAMLNGAGIANFSFTGFDVDPAFLFAVETAYDAGIVVVSSVGNSDNGTDLDLVPAYPACFFSKDGEDLVIGVAATGADDARASFSNYGAQCTDVSAPGEDLLSAMYFDATLSDFETDAYGYWSGTSVATPLVSGAAALLRAVDPLLSPSQILTILQLSVDPLAEKDTDAAGKLGAGRLNLEKALAFVPNFPGEMAAPVGPVGVSPSHALVAAEAASSSSEIRSYNAQGELTTSFRAYETDQPGGVRLAMGDVNGDGKDEIVTAPGPGGAPEVRVFDTNGNLLWKFDAFRPDDLNGVFVACGDMNHDGTDEVIASQDAGGGGRVRFFDREGTAWGEFLPYDATRKSVRVASGDIDGDGQDELVLGLGSGGEPRVRLFEPDGSFISEFNAYADAYDRGIFVGAGDIDGDGTDEIVTGTDNGGGPHVRAFDRFGNVRAHFFAYDEQFRGGVRIAVGDIDGNGTAEIYTAAGPGGGPQARIFNAAGEAIGGFFAFDEAARDGLNLAIW